MCLLHPPLPPLDDDVDVDGDGDDDDDDDDDDGDGDDDCDRWPHVGFNYLAEW